MEFGATFAPCRWCNDNFSHTLHPATSSVHGNTLNEEALQRSRLCPMVRESFYREKKIRKLQSSRWEIEKAYRIQKTDGQTPATMRKISTSSLLELAQHANAQGNHEIKQKIHQNKMDATFLWKRELEIWNANLRLQGNWDNFIYLQFR